MRKFLLILNTILLASLAYFGGLKDICDWWPSLCNMHEITLTIKPKENVKAGDIINLNYEVPQSGYLALWNWNSNGEIKEMIAATPVNAENYRKSYSIEASNTGGMEHVIILWSEKNPLQLASNYYATTSGFDSALKALGGDIERKDDEVQVYRREQE